MTGTILIVDSVATNRIVWRVKLAAAQYNVLTASNCNEADDIFDAQKPDLMIINLSDPTEDSHLFCQSLRERYPLGSLGILATGVADTHSARFAAMDAGADDVLPHPINDTLMLARIRSLLRRKSSSLDWCMPEETARAFGFEEEMAPRLAAPIIRFTQTGTSRLTETIAALANGALFPVRSETMTSVLTKNGATCVTDLFILEGSVSEDAEKIAGLVTELRSRRASSEAELLVLIPAEMPELAARLFDLGAADVATHSIGLDELERRVHNLITQKTKRDRTKETVKNGLFEALTDPLTGLHNRRFAKNKLKQIAEEARIKRKPYAVMMLDIDHFKQINDRFGHDAGDQVLAKMANRLKENFRAIDMIARVGGEEFLIGMPDTSLAQAEVAAERMRRTVNKKPFCLQNSSVSIRATVSVGVAIHDASDPKPATIETMFQLADRALYQAKSCGRNKVAVNSRAA